MSNLQPQQDRADKLRSKCQLRHNSQRITKKAAAKWASGQTAAAAAAAASVSLLLLHSTASTAVIRSRTTRTKAPVKVAKGGRQSTLLARQGYYRALKWPPHHRIGDDDNGLTGVGLVSSFRILSLALQVATASAATIREAVASPTATPTPTPPMDSKCEAEANKKPETRNVANTKSVKCIRKYPNTMMVSIIGKYNVSFQYLNTNVSYLLVSYFWFITIHT